MAVNRVPVLKRCRSLGLEPAYLGYDKKSNRTARTGKKMSEYGLQLREKQKQNSSTAFWKSLSVTTTRRQTE